MLYKVSFLKRLEDGKTRAFAFKELDAPSIVEAVVWAGKSLQETKDAALVNQTVAVRVMEAKGAE